MFISKKSLPRRTFLKGLGVTMALPFLDAMAPALTASAQSPASPVRRLGFIYIPHGANDFWAPEGQRWKPPTIGDNFEFSTVLKPLEPYRSHVTVISELSRLGTGGHPSAPSGWLGGLTNVKRTDGADIFAGVSIDQVLSKRIGQATAFPTLEVATEDFTGYVGACDIGIACSYYNSISWSTPSTPQPMDIDPRSVFERMFGRPGTAAQRLARIGLQKSILDSIGQDVSTLQRGLGASDRSRLEEYLGSLREIERRIQQTEAANQKRVTLSDAPAGIPDAFEDHANLMFDLLAVAYQADMTRIATFMLCRELSQRTYVPQAVLSEPHHSMSHHANDPDKLLALSKIQMFHVSLFARFVDKLSKTPDGDGSLLDHSLIAYGSGMGNSNGHTPDNLPLVLVGGAGGRMKGNRHIEAAARTPLPNVWLSIAEKFDAPMEKHGISTGKFDL